MKLSSEATDRTEGAPEDEDEFDDIMTEAEWVELCHEWYSEGIGGD